MSDINPGFLSAAGGPWITRCASSIVAVDSAFRTLQAVGESATRAGMRLRQAMTDLEQEKRDAGLTLIETVLLVVVVLLACLGAYYLLLH